ncbi:unnamed protein product [Scytosiphon promiscuus]
MTDEEMALDQALIQRVTEEVEAESGVELDQLINPAKVINLERDLVKLRAALESGPGGERSAIEEEIEKKESTLVKEKRMYMQGWLKKVFVGQAVITTILGGTMAYDQVPFFPHVDLSIQVLGFWFVWLFTVPSLRARKPGASEKVALDIAFLLTPVVSFGMPFITKVSLCQLCCLSGSGHAVSSHPLRPALRSTPNKRSSSRYRLPWAGASNFLF